MMGSPPDKNETKIMASKKMSKRMKRLLGNIAQAEGVDNTLPVTERLKMFLDGRINVKDIETGELLDPMLFGWARKIDGKFYDKFPVYQVICTNGVLQRKYLPYNTQCSRQ
jgi:hypothetical protein